VGNLRDLCVNTGGTFSVQGTKRGTKYTTCNESDGSVTKCTATKKAVSCHTTRTAPSDAGPAAPPLDGVYEDVAAGGSGGGIVANPSGIAEQPENPAVIQTFDGGEQDSHAERHGHDGKRRRHGGKHDRS
jgi:hypothetical protein